MERGDQRMRRAVPHHRKHGKTQSFNEHLHTQARHVPPAIVEYVAEETLQRSGRRVRNADLLMDQP
jgi:hypothetical protein